MQLMRDLLRTTLGKSLDALTPLDRLSAAWTVTAGQRTSERTSVTGLDGSVATITVPDSAWQSQLRSMGPQLTADLSRVSRVPLTDILFLLPEAAVAPPRAQSAKARKSTSSAVKSAARKKR